MLNYFSHPNGTVKLGVKIAEHEFKKGNYLVPSPSYYT